MPNHHNYITHIDNKKDVVYLKTTHFPVNMRLFHSSPEYRNIILRCCEYIEWNCLTEKEGYKKPHGMSSANLGLSFNIIGITLNRNIDKEYCKILINPKILEYFDTPIKTKSNCGSLTLKKPIIIKRYPRILVDYYDLKGENHKTIFDVLEGSTTIQHEIDHNNGILITDRI